MDYYAAAKEIFPNDRMAVNVGFKTKRSKKETVTFWKSEAGNKQPTEEQFKAAWARVQEKRNAVAYKANRAKEYPAIGDQLDAILKWVTSERFQGEDLPQDLDDIIGQWTAVKKKHPKPGK